MSTSPVPYSPKNKRMSYPEFNEKMSSLAERTNPFDQSSPMSLISLLPDSLKVRFNSYSVQEAMRLGEDKLEDKLKPELTLKRIRINMWNDFVKMQDFMVYKNKRQAGGNKFCIGIEKMCSGVCYPKYFYDKVIENDLAMAYLFTPPVSYEVIVQENLQLGFQRLKEILSFPIYKEKTLKDGTVVREPNTDVANIILKTIAILDLRVNGPIPKVIHQDVSSKNINYNMNEKVEIDNGLLDIEDLDRRIEEIRSETHTIINSPTYSRIEKDIILESQEGLAND